jgi:hypothetical protein
VVERGVDLLETGRVGRGDLGGDGSRAGADDDGVAVVDDHAGDVGVAEPLVRVRGRNGEGGQGDDATRSGDS